MATWEALIEPIEKFTATGESVLKPWEVNLKMVVQKDKEDPTQGEFHVHYITHYKFQ